MNIFKNVANRKVVMEDVTFVDDSSTIAAPVEEEAAIRGTIRCKGCTCTATTCVCQTCEFIL